MTEYEICLETFFHGASSEPMSGYKPLDFQAH
jgi:hypothetical protein